MESNLRTMKGHEAPRPGNRLPPVSLPRVPSGEPVAWRLPRGARVLVFVADSNPGHAKEYLAALGEWRGRLRVWDGRPLIVLPGSAQAMGGAEVEGLEGLDVEGLPYPAVADPDDAARRRCGLEPDDWAVLIADRWGEIYKASISDSPAGLPAPAEIEEWLRFIVTQCPECGVPDAATRGEWAE